MPFRTSRHLLSLALGLVLWSVSPAFANSGGAIDPNGNYTGVYTGAGQGDANAASVTIDGALSTSVYGGYSESGSSTGNKVTVSGSADVTDDVTGGAAQSGNAVNNTITMSGGTVQGYLYGGSSIDGFARGNSVSVQGGTVHDRIYAGYSENGIVSGNTLTVTNGTMFERIYGGYQYENGSVAGNAVVISGGIMGDNVYGGYISRGGGSATTNVVNISNGDIQGDVYGGRSSSGDALGNRINLNGGTVGGSLNGGLVNSGAGAASGNSIIMSGSAEVGGDVTGGSAQGGNAVQNSTVMSGSAEVGGDVTGGSAQSGNAVQNSTVLSGGTVWGYLYGGSSIDGLAADNRATVQGGTVHDRIYAGYSENGLVSGNTLTITGGTMFARVYGGYQYENGSVMDNSAMISGGILQDNVYGGYISRGGGSATGNVASIGNGDIQGDVYGGRSNSGDALGNRINLSGGTVGGGLYGGLVNSGMGAASGNSIVISGSAEVGGDVTGGSAQGGKAIDNTIIMSGGTVGGYLYGGSSIDGSATGNSVAIGGGHLAGNVYGGYFSRGTGSATGNNVTISGTPTFGATAIIYGGSTNTGSGDVRTGNTLTVATKGISAGNIANFQNYNFVLFSGGGAGLTLGDTSGTDMGGTASSGRFTVTGILPGPLLQPGSSVVLLRNAAGLVNVPTLGSGQFRQNSILVLDYSLRSTGTDILADIKSVQVTPENKALSEGRAASLAFTSLGSDLVAGAGMDAARKGMASPRERAGVESAAYGLVPFYAMSGSSMRYNSGSHVNVNGVALMTGLAKQWRGPAVDTLAGAFFETASGSYKTHNSIDGIGSVDGKGDTRTVGGGILARIDLTDTALKGLYAEASFRFGSLTSDYKSGELRDTSGRTASYSVNTPYCGVHAGLGYSFTMTERANLDVYAKYFWAHQEGQSSTILGNTFDFDAMDSRRIRLGGRFAYAATETVRPYMGVAWEHEFDGKARATTSGYDVPAPSLKGSSGMGEMGLTWKPLSTQGFSVDFGVQGYLGQREGVSGNLQLRYAF